MDSVNLKMLKPIRKLLPADFPTDEQLKDEKEMAYAEYLVRKTADMEWRDFDYWCVDRVKNYSREFQTSKLSVALEIFMWFRHSKKWDGFKWTHK